jgi:hypothetical protein
MLSKSLFLIEVIQCHKSLQIRPNNSFAEAKSNLLPKLSILLDYPLLKERGRQVSKDATVAYKLAVYFDRQHPSRA